MIGRRLVALAALAALAAAPPKTREILPEPPMPPDFPPLDDAAPMPNIELDAPMTASPAGPRFQPDLIRPQRQFRGDGYAPGSSPQAVEERTVPPTPGFRLLVPLR